MARGDLKLARLFYQIEADTSGLKRELDSAEKAFGRITSFIMDNPVAAAGALAAAFVAVGIKATRMAEQTDTAVRRIGAILPDAARKAELLKTGVDNLAKASGVSQEQLMATATTIAREGVSTTEELLTRLKLVQGAADATGADMATLATGLDQVLDTFGLGTDKLEEVVAKLRAAGQGREPIEDLLAAIQAAAPGLKAAGIDFDVGAKAIANLVAEGYNAKQAGSALKQMAAQGGEAVRRFAGEAINARDAIRGLHEAEDLVAGSTERQSAKIRETLNSTLRELGDIILPAVNSGLSLILSTLNAIVAKGADHSLANAIQLAFTVKPTGAAAGPGGRGGAVQLPDVTVVADPAVAEAAKRFTEHAHDVALNLVGILRGAAVQALEAFLEEYNKIKDTLTAQQQAQAEKAIAALKVQVALSGELPGVKADPNAPPPLKVLDTEKMAQYVERQRKAWEGSHEKAGLVAKDAAAAKQQAIELGRQIEQAGRGAIQLAAAFGLLNTNAAAALVNIVDIAGAVPGALKGDVSSIISGLGALAGLMSGLFGESPQDKAYREELQKNSDALAQLTKEIGNFGYNITGGQFAAVRSAVDAALNNLVTVKGARGREQQVIGNESGILAQYGVSIADITALAKELGITFHDTIAGFRELQKALQETELTQFAQTLDGKLRALDDRATLFGLDAQQQLEAMAQVFGFKGIGGLGSEIPAIATALKGLNLNDPSQRAEAKKRLEALFDQLSKGTLDASQLGNATLDQFEQVLLEFGRLIDSANTEAGQVTQNLQESAGVTRQITDAQADQLIALAVTQDAHLIEIRDLLAGAFGGTVAAPPLTQLAALSQAALGGPISITLTVEVSGPVDATNAEAVGQVVGGSAALAIRRTLGADVARGKMVAGDVTVN